MKTFTKWENTPKNVKSFRKKIRKINVNVGIRYMQVPNVFNSQICQNQGSATIPNKYQANNKYLCTLQHVLCNGQVLGRIWEPNDN